MAICLRNEVKDATHEDDKYAGTGKEKSGRPNIRWPYNIREDMKECSIAEDMAENRTTCVEHGDNSYPITIWRKLTCANLRTNG